MSKKVSFVASAFFAVLLGLGLEWGGLSLLLGHLATVGQTAGVTMLVLLVLGLTTEADN